MSAWLLAKGHVDAIVQASIVTGQIQMSEADDLGAALFTENYLSLNARYGDQIPDKINYTFSGIEAPLDPHIIRAAIASWDYQSCEHGDAFYNSDIYKKMMELSDLLNDGSDADYNRGWCIEDIDEAVLKNG